jgi:CheY-like chemotaxis protein
MARILVVEDSPLICLGYEVLFEEHGHQVACCETAEQALERIHGFGPDALVVDHHLPLMSGWELLRRLRARRAWANLPAVLVTGSHTAPRTLFDAVLMKPVGERTLLAAVDRAIVAAASRRPERASAA